jgi:hypothetical protein
VWSGGFFEVCRDILEKSRQGVRRRRKKKRKKKEEKRKKKRKKKGKRLQKHAILGSNNRKENQLRWQM